MLTVLTLLAVPAVAQLVPEGAVVEKVADGYRFTEGPAAGPGGCIYFTDIPAELILKFDPESGETTTFREDTGRANGLMWFEGDLYMCCHKARGILMYPLHPGWPSVAEDLRRIVGENATDYDPLVPIIKAARMRSARRDGHGDAVRLNSPNDLAIDSSGNIYFTDPRYGNREDMESDIEGVYFRHINSGVQNPGQPASARMDAELTRPNGIVLSPDESVLYVADHAANWVYAYDIVDPGQVENKRQFAQLNNGEGRGSDGMCVDVRGRVYATGQGKVWVFEPSGDLVTTIDVGPQTTNCTFAHDGRTLYITANKGLYRIELNTQEPLAAILIEITKDGDLTLDGERIEGDQLGAELQGVPGFSLDRVVVIRADAETRFALVSGMWDMLNEMGIEDVRFATRRVRDAER
ncbi:MAG: SMP-30/gluconolactonase/LRE family protein [Planctomycetota bacterium]